MIWAYLGIIFEILTETVAWERWEGTIEYTFMAPLSRPVHLIGMGLFAVGYGVVRAVLLFGVVAAFFGLHLPDANYAAALVRADRRLDLVHRDRDDDGGPAADLAGEGHAARLRRAGPAARRLGRLLPGLGAAAWMQWLSKISPATYALRGCRAAIINGAGLTDLTTEIWALLVIGAVSVPLGPVDLPHRRALRQEARKAEAVGMTARSPATPTSSSALASAARSRRWLRRPNSGGQWRTGCSWILDGGYVYVNHSSVVGSAYAMVRVLPERRRAGIGSALVEAAAASARELGHESAWGCAQAGDEESLGFVSRRGFAEVGRNVELTRRLSPEAEGFPAGILELGDEHRVGAYAVSVAAVPDMPTAGAAEARSFDDWFEQELAAAVAAFVVLEHDTVGRLRDPAGDR